MRDIKFKIWDSEFEEFSDYHFNRTAFNNFIKTNTRFYLLQYTGLKDQQGKGDEIYEGDYFEQHGIKWFVEWQEDLCRFVLTTGFGYDSKNCVDLTCDEVFYLKIKGNKQELNKANSKQHNS